MPIMLNRDEIHPFEIVLYNKTKDGGYRRIEKSFDNAYDMYKFYVKMRPPKRPKRDKKVDENTSPESPNLGV